MPPVGEAEAIHTLAFVAVIFASASALHRSGDRVA
jgi:hypothetical protein